MFGLFRRAERREANLGYTELALQEAYSRAVSETTAIALIASEAALRLISGAFCMVEWRGDRMGAVTRAWAQTAARQMLATGNSVSVIQVAPGMRAPALLHAGTYDVIGRPGEAWSYRCDLYAPSGNQTLRLSGDAVIHLRHCPDATRVWHGRSPLDRARASTILAASVERALADELRVPTGRIVPLPQGASDDVRAGLKTALANLKGGVALPSSVSTGFGQGAVAAPMRDWRPETLRPEPAAETLALRSDLAHGIYALFGVPPALLGSRQAQGAAAGTREAWRVFQYATLEPLGRVFEEELSAKLDAPIRADWSRLRAADIAGAARAYKSLLEAGMDKDKAGALTGMSA